MYFFNLVNHENVFFVLRGLVPILPISVFFTYFLPPHYTKQPFYTLPSHYFYHPFYTFTLIFSISFHILDIISFVFSYLHIFHIICHLFDIHRMRLFVFIAIIDLFIECFYHESVVLLRVWMWFLDVTPASRSPA